MTVIRVLTVSSLVATLQFSSCGPVSSSDYREPSQREPSQEWKNAVVAGHRKVKSYDRESSGLDIVLPYVIYQDREGVFWIGGASGVDRYDEAQDKWTHFNSGNSGLTLNHVALIGQSSDGKLWFGAGSKLGGRLQSFDGKRWETHDHRSGSPLAKNTVFSVSAMFPGRGGKLWFAAGAVLFAHNSGKWTERFNVMEMAHVPLTINRAIEDSEGYVWLTGIDTIIRLDATRTRWKTYLKPDGMRSISDVSCVYEDRAGRIWFGGFSGVVAVNDKRGDHWRTFDLNEYLPADPRRDFTQVGEPDLTAYVRAIYEDRPGRIMFATPRGLAVSTEDGSRWEVFRAQNSPLPSSSVYSILEDNAGRIWLGTNSGILVLEP